MNRQVRKIISLVVIVLMLMSAVPMTSFAVNPMCSIIGHNIETVVTKEASCTEAGLKVEKCTRTGCDYVTGKTEVIPYKSHVIATIDPVAPTCAMPGNTSGTYCSVCNLIILPCETIPALGHTPVSFDGVEAKCEINGMNNGTKCKTCGIVITGGTVIPAPGHNYKQISFSEGSCIDGTPSMETYFCMSCGYEKTVTIEANHSFSNWKSITQSTCTTSGKAVRSCKICNIEEIKIIDQLPHTWIIEVEKPATCTEFGIATSMKCTVCGLVEGRQTIPALGHKEVIVAGYPASCGKKGLTDGSYCKVCNVELKPQVEIAAFEHIIEIDKSASKNPTCTAEGLIVEQCIRAGCGFTNKIVLPKTHGEGLKVVKAATCTEEGKKSGYCKSCNQTVVETIPAMGHLVTNVLSWKIIVSPSCDKEGERVATCSRCGGRAVEVIPALGHQEVVFTPAKEPTCSDEGATASKQCSICKTITVKAVKIDKLPHIFGEWIETKTATCKAAGVKEAKCTVCGATEHETIQRLPHTEEIIPAKDATCIEAGYTKNVTCTVCKEVIERSKTIEALGHNYIRDNERSVDPDCVNGGKFYGVCDRCGDIKDEFLPANGHDEDVVPGTPADCTLTGVSDFKKCKVCGEITAEPEQTPALGHDFVIDAAKSTPSTCTESGYEYLNCTRCKATDFNVIPAMGHVDFDGNEICDICSDAIVINTVCSTYGHDFDWFTIITPSCFREGVNIEKCKRMGCYYATGNTETLPKKEHVIKIIDAVSPTCVKPGKSEGAYCLVCGEFLKNSVTIDPLGHDYQPEWQTVVPATCTQTGVLVKICKNCLNIQSKTLPVASHKDENGDNICDMCLMTLTSLPTGSCTCNCHKTGIANIFFKLMLFFQKLFRVNRICKCGVAHY